MTAPGGPITDLLIPQRRAIALPALTLGASFEPQPPASPSIASPPPPPDRSNRSPSNAPIAPRPIGAVVAAANLARETAPASALSP